MDHINISQENGAFVRTHLNFFVVHCLYEVQKGRLVRHDPYSDTKNDDSDNLSIGTH